MWKRIITNWTTSIPGALIGICAATELAGLLPEEWFRYWMGGCGFLTAMGFLAAKSANVSNSPHPVESAPVSTVNSEKPNPSAVPPPMPPPFTTT